MPETRMGMRKNSEERPPDTAARENPTNTLETPASVEENSKGETSKAVEGRMSLTTDMSVSQVGSPESIMGQMSAARGSAESNWPGKGSPARERSSLGLEERELSILPQEDVEDEGKPEAVPKLQSFEEMDMLKRPPFVLCPEHWLGSHEEFRQKLWQAYRLVNAATFAKAEQSLKVMKAISRAWDGREEGQQGFRRETRESLQLEETARRMWMHDRELRDTKCIASAEALVKWRPPAPISTKFSTPTSTTLYSSINKLYAQNQVFEIVPDEDVKIYLHMYNGNVQQNPLGVESCVKEVFISPLVSATIFDPDKNSVFLHEHTFAQQ